MTLTFNVQERWNIDIKEHLVAIGDAVGVEATRHRAYVRRKSFINAECDALHFRRVINEWMNVWREPWHETAAAIKMCLTYRNQFSTQRVLILSASTRAIHAFRMWIVRLRFRSQIKPLSKIERRT